MFNDFQRSIQVGDFIKFIQRNANRCNSHNNGYGEVISSDLQRLKVVLFQTMDSETLQKYNLQPINPSEIPLAFEDRITEMYKTSEILFVDRSDIQDILFIIPVAEVESGVFHLSGADNVFCTRFVKENQI
jgi:hypothetical protein